jgi:hypothetical protein
MRGWVIRACAEIAENTEKNGRKIDKSLCVLRVLSGKFRAFLQNPSRVCSLDQEYAGIGASEDAGVPGYSWQEV